MSKKITKNECMAAVARSDKRMTNLTPEERTKLRRKFLASLQERKKSLAPCA